MDPYELYFVFHAFITVYEETGDGKVLDSVMKLADYFLDNFGPGKNEFWPSDLRAPDNYHQVLSGHSLFAGHSVHYCWEGTLLCDPMARLYQVTGEKRYLDWSIWVVNNIDKWSGWDAFSRLDDVAAGRIGVDELQPFPSCPPPRKQTPVFRCSGDSGRQSCDSPPYPVCQHRQVASR